MKNLCKKRTNTNINRTEDTLIYFKDWTEKEMKTDLKKFHEYIKKAIKK